MNATSPCITKQEALGLLSDHIRKKSVDGNTLLKLLVLYSALAGWDEEQEPSKEPSLNELITIIERGCKATAP